MTREINEPGDCPSLPLAGGSCNGKAGHVGKHWHPLIHADGCRTILEWERDGEPPYPANVPRIPHFLVSWKHPHTIED
jgi:hypothetical protein